MIWSLTALLCCGLCLGMLWAAWKELKETVKFADVLRQICLDQQRMVDQLEFENTQLRMLLSGKTKAVNE